MLSSSAASKGYHPKLVKPPNLPKHWLLLPASPATLADLAEPGPVFAVIFSPQCLFPQHLLVTNIPPYSTFCLFCGNLFAYSLILSLALA
ncbi:hypothetical protein [Entomobacter blattae]|uniref:Uncharacterized protein n=1 Tax=Entomobacter blattae TaxID=2762277 RepID=A0A7H1NQT9_9PROT|nr:hypothetical protein [Entomobacter blattae]QNT78149.1 hypothetical protein JGUZn3_09170 [Entomobacter blattae]